MMSKNYLEDKMNVFIKDNWLDDFTIENNDIKGMDEKIINLQDKRLSLNDLKKLFNLYTRITAELENKLGAE